MRMKNEDIPKTAFQTHQGHFKLVMPFELNNALVTFQALMNTIFQPYFKKFILVFFDDNLIYSKEWRSHLQHIDQTLTILREQQLFWKKTRCQFAVQCVKYLGHVISQKGVEMDKEKIQAVIGWPQSKSVKAMRGFLGLAGYYKKFVQNFAVIGYPLRTMLKKGLFKWMSEVVEAFAKLKIALISAPILQLPDFNLHLVVECDASSAGLGAVLLQGNKPTAYFSKALRGVHRSFYSLSPLWFL